MSNIVYKYDCSYKDDVRDFSYIMNALLRKYNNECLFKAIGIEESEFNTETFSKEQFRNAIDLYLKEMSKH